MKRTISEITPAADENLEVIVARRANNHVSTHADHLTRLIIHFRDMAGLMSQLSKTEQLRETLYQLSLKTPLASVFGQQSSGKSTVLDLMYFNGNGTLHAAHGLGTRCPLEMRIGPQYNGAIYIRPDDGDARYDYETLEAAQEAMLRYDNLVNARIIMESRDNTMTT